MELYEFIEYNYGQKNEAIASKLETALNNIVDNENIDENIKKDIYVALGMAKGYTEYKRKQIANDIGVSKTAVKFMVDNLIAENKIKLVKENNVTFIVPVF